MIKIANVPCLWGILEFDLKGEVAEYAQVLNEMQATGYGLLPDVGYPSNGSGSRVFHR
jgi:hypothetical protein